MDNRKILLTLISLFHLVFSASQFSMTKLSCDVNPEFIRNLTCDLKPIKRNVKHLKIQFVVFKPMDSIKIRIRNMKKTSANRYMPGTFDFTKDLCEIMAPNSTETFLLNFANAIYKKSIDRLRQIIHPCPYSVNTTLSITSYTIFENAVFQGPVNYEEIEDERSVPSVTILESGNYRTDVDLYSKANVQYFNLKVYFSVNLRS